MDRCDSNVAKTEDELRTRVVRLVKDVSRPRSVQNQLDLYENPYTS